MPYSIMLDAGHGGEEPGAVYMGRQEKDDTLNLVLAIGEILQNNGIDVEYTRTTDVYESSYQYTEIPVQFRTSTWEWRALYMIFPASNMRWQKISMPNWKR